MADLKTTLAANIKRLRTAKNLSQADLAEKCGLTAGAIGHYETGSRGFSSDNVEAIARALNVEPTDLFYPGSQPEPVVIRPSLWDAIVVVGEAIRDIQKGRIPKGTDRESILRRLAEIQEGQSKKPPQPKAEKDSEE